MDETDLIKTLQTRLDSSLSVPVKTSGMEDERPVPVVIIDDWDTQDLNHHNSARAGSTKGDFDDDGNIELEWYLNFNFETRVELLVRHYDEVDVSKLKEKAKHELRLIRENPQNFHQDLKSCYLGRDGNPTYQLLEPKEAELMLSARFNGDHTVTRTPDDTQYDAIQQIQETFTFNP